MIRGRVICIPQGDKDKVAPSKHWVGVPSFSYLMIYLIRRMPYISEEKAEKIVKIRSSVVRYMSA